MANKYYWIKLKTDFFNLDEVDFLLSQENGCKYIVLYQMLCLKTANNGGTLNTKIGEMIIPYDVNKIARDTKYFDVDTIVVAMELFKKLNLIYEETDGTLRISELQNMVGSESASREAIKKREYRFKKLSKDNKVDKMGTKCPTDIRYKILDNNICSSNDERDSISFSPSEIPNKEQTTQNGRTTQENFDLLWNIYPRKQGKNKAYGHYLVWLKGKKYAGSRLRLDNNMMWCAINRYNEANKDTDKQYIQMGSTFFNDTIAEYISEEDRLDEQSKIAKTSTNPTTSINEDNGRTS